MSAILDVVLVVGAGAGLAYAFVPGVRQLFRINGNKIIKNASTPLDRVTDNVNQAIAKLPTQRALVASLMTAGEKAQKAADAKRTEVETLFAEVNTAINAKASDATITTYKQRWLAAKNAIPALDAAAVEAHNTAEDAQQELESLIAQIQESQAGVEKLKSDSQLTEILHQSGQLRQQVNDLKNGLGANADDVTAIQDGLSNARNANELSKGSAADREMADIKKKAQAGSADDAFAAELAARSAARQVTPPRRMRQSRHGHKLCRAGVFCSFRVFQPSESRHHLFFKPCCSRASRYLNRHTRSFT